MTETEITKAFEERKPILNAMGAWVTATIIKGLEKELGCADAIEYFLKIPPKPRVKKTDSFVEKALFRKFKENPLVEITDQVGVRFVVLLLEDIGRVGKIVQSGPWNYSKDRDHEEERKENPNYFAYQSDHYVITTKENVDFEGITIPAAIPCEVQIRTILQHAYAEMAHYSDYKPSIKLPDNEQKTVKRSLAKGSALIETTDDVFSKIQANIREYKNSTNALLVAAGKIYEKMTTVPTCPLTALGALIIETYKHQLTGLTVATLEEWTTSQSSLGEIIKEKRNKSVFYREPVIIILAWLIDTNQTTIPRSWPIDSLYLQEYYLSLGISTDGIF